MEGQSLAPARWLRGQTRRPPIIVHARGRSCISRAGRRRGVQLCLGCAIDDRACSQAMTSRP
eukprot:8688702-Pyramimonas_sp.AAC.1